MIPVDSLLYKIDQRLNKLSTNAHQQIPLEDKILALNEAQIKLIKQKVDGQSTISGLGLDAFKKRYEDLQRLVVSYKDLPLTLVSATLNQYAANLDLLTPKYMFYVDAYVIASKDKCIDRRIWINKDLAKHGDISMLLNNDHYKPSFEYQETFNSLSSNQMSIYTDGTFNPTRLWVSYMRYPVYIDKAGYTKFNGAPSTNVNCELEEYLEDELLDLTVQNLAMYVENQSAVEMAAYRIKTNE